MNSLAHNVRRSIPQEEKTREEHVAAHIIYMNTGVYLIDYNGDQNLPYNIPLTVGEWLISHGYLEDSLRYIGGQGLVDRVGGLGWLLLLLLEIVPNSFKISNAEAYREVFSKDDAELTRYVANKIDDGDYLNYMIWICYVALSECTLGITNDQDFTNTIFELGVLSSEMQMSLYSMLIGLAKPLMDEFDSDLFIEAFTVPKFINYCNMLKLAQTVQDIVVQWKINFGILESNNPSSVLLAKWFSEDYGSVDVNKKIEDVDVEKINELSRVSDVEILKRYDIIKLYIGRTDLLLIVYNAVNFGYPAIAKDELEDFSRLVFIKGTLYGYDQSKFIITKNYDEQMLETTYNIGANNQKEDELITVISSIIDYKNVEDSYYDRLRNAEIYYTEKTDVKESIAYLYLGYIVQNGHYSGAYGLPYTRVESYLYSTIVGDFIDSLMYSKYYSIPIGIIENGFLLQGESIKRKIRGRIKFDDIINTCRLYGVDFNTIVEIAKDIWGKYYAENYGMIKPTSDVVVNNTYFLYRSSANYIEYLKRLSIMIHYTNEFDFHAKHDIVMFKEEEEEEEEEEEYESEDDGGAY